MLTNMSKKSIIWPYDNWYPSETWAPNPLHPVFILLSKIRNTLIEPIVPNFPSLFLLKKHHAHNKVLSCCFLESHSRKYYYSKWGHAHSFMLLYQCLLSISWHEILLVGDTNLLLNISLLNRQWNAFSEYTTIHPSCSEKSQNLIHSLVYRGIWPVWSC